MFLNDQLTLKSRGPIPIYYETRYGTMTLNPGRVHFVLKANVPPRSLVTRQAANAKHVHLDKSRPCSIVLRKA